MVKYYGCYDYNEEWYLIEMLLDVSFSEVEWSGIFVPEEGVSRADWQVPYMEQYLNEAGTERVCELYDTPKEREKPCRIAFFIYKVPVLTLSTPYGDFALSADEKVPERLKGVVEFEECD